VILLKGSVQQHVKYQNDFVSVSDTNFKLMVIYYAEETNNWAVTQGFHVMEQNAQFLRKKKLI
jgi:hypothetical protein